MGRRLHLPGNVDDLVRQMKQIWEEIQQEIIREIYHSMPRRVVACVQAKAIEFCFFFRVPPPLASKIPKSGVKIDMTKPFAGEKFRTGTMFFDLQKIIFLVQPPRNYFRWSHLRSNHWSGCFIGSVTPFLRGHCSSFLLVLRDLEPFLETGNAGRRPGQGRRRATTPNKDRYLVLTARRHQNMNATLLQQHLRSATGTTVSTQTVRNRLHGIGLYARRSMAYFHLEGPGSRNNPVFVHESVRFGGGVVLVYGGISIDGRTDLYII
ncbi:transposable element Tcb2 transposase [Trichonephila clavipes]|nr:transposable element Tcb2 transposase [Trichonephila clavipes]